jgi:hypothetical protein
VRHSQRQCPSCCQPTIVRRSSSAAASCLLLDGGRPLLVPSRTHDRSRLEDDDKRASVWLRSNSKGDMLVLATTTAMSCCAGCSTLLLMSSMRVCFPTTSCHTAPLFKNADMSLSHIGIGSILPSSGYGRVLLRDGRTISSLATVVRSSLCCPSASIERLKR